jgi:hypothetical protein
VLQTATHQQVNAVWGHGGSQVVSEGVMALFGESTCLIEFGQAEMEILRKWAPASWVASLPVTLFVLFCFVRMSLIFKAQSKRTRAESEITNDNTDVRM